MLDSHVSTAPTSVGMGELKVQKKSGAIGCIGLGSCVGLLLFDPVVSLAALAHVMLPECGNPANEPLLGKFADTAVPAVIDAMLTNGANRRRLIATLIGGAELFQPTSSQVAFKIGSRNTEKVTQLLEKAGIPVVFRDVGGRNGRSFNLDVATGRLVIRTPAGQQQEFNLKTETAGAARAA